MADDPMQVTSNESGLVRVFAAEAPVEGAPAMTGLDAVHALGAEEAIDPERVEVFAAKRIAPMSLTSYLHQAYGVPEDALAEHRGSLDALEGYVVLVPSGAVTGKPLKLSPDATLRHLGTFAEEGAAPPRRMAESASASGAPPVPPEVETPPAGPSRRGSAVIVVAALVVAALLVLFVAF